MAVTEKHPPAGTRHVPGPFRPMAGARGGRRPAVEPGIGLAAMVLPRAWARTAVLLAGLGASLWVCVSTLHPGTSGSGAVALVAVVMAALGWLGWVAARVGGRLLPVSLAVLAVAGGVAAATGAAGLIFVGVAAAGAATAFDLPAAIPLAATGPASFLVAAGVRGDLPGALLGVAAVCLLGLLSGTGRRQLVARAEQSTLLSTADQRADLASQQAALAAERNRLARELHDVLAHTLGALAIQLNAVEALVDSGASHAVLREHVRDAHALVAEGLQEARHAVAALREDSPPLAEQLARLARQHHATVQIDGAARPLAPETSLALYRVAQEALTNAAKHAPAAPVRLAATFTATDVAVSVCNEAPGPATDPATGTSATGTWLAGSGGGYGLAGMGERVRLAGGQFRAGPADGGWQVTARIPDPTPTSPARPEEQQ